MHEFECGLRISEQHTFFVPEFWCQVLSCFSDMEAIHLDTVYGNTQTKWLVRHRMHEVPGPATWLQAVKFRSIGMLMYLQQFQVSCPHFNRHVQTACNLNHVDTLLFFIQHQHNIKDEFGESVTLDCPTLDRAISRDYSCIVRIIINTFPRQKDRMLMYPGQVMYKVMSRQLFGMLKLIVPQLTKIYQIQCLQVAAKKGYKSMLKYALQHLDKHYLSLKHLPVDIVLAAAKYGHLNVVKLILKVTKQTIIPEIIFQTAFEYGHVKLCAYIHKKQAERKTEYLHEYIPQEKRLLSASAQGHYKMFQYLRKKYTVRTTTTTTTTVASFSSLCTLPFDIPEKCLVNAIQSKEFRMIDVLCHLKQDFQFTPAIFQEAVRSADSRVMCIVFSKGKYKQLYNVISMVGNHMRKALQFFNKLKYNVYNDQTLLKAAQICDVGIIKDCCESKRYKPSKNVLLEAQSYVYVSGSSYCQEAFTYLEFICRQLYEKEEIDDEHIVGHKRKRRNNDYQKDVSLLNHNNQDAFCNQLTRAKRAKQIPH